MLVAVVPAHNEEKTIGRVVRDLFDNGVEKVVVVDDGSTDKTAQEAKDNGAILLCHPINRGQGAALQTGNVYCKSLGADLVIHFDADGQFDATDVKTAVEALAKSGADVLLGSRFLDNRSQIPWFKKNIILPVARKINYFFSGIKLSDAHNGFRILTRVALDKINITHDGMAHNTEIIRQIKKNNLKYLEFPVVVKYAEFGQGLGGGIRIIIDLIKETFI